MDYYYTIIAKYPYKPPPISSYKYQGIIDRYYKSPEELKLYSSDVKPEGQPPESIQVLAAIYGAKEIPITDKEALNIAAYFGHIEQVQNPTAEQMTLLLNSYTEDKKEIFGEMLSRIKSDETLDDRVIKLNDLSLYEKLKLKSDEKQQKSIVRNDALALQSKLTISKTVLLKECLFSKKHVYIDFLLNSMNATDAVDILLSYGGERFIEKTKGKTITKSNLHTKNLERLIVRSDENHRNYGESSEYTNLKNFADIVHVNHIPEFKITKDIERLMKRAIRESATEAVLSLYKPPDKDAIQYLIENIDEEVWTNLKKKKNVDIDLKEVDMSRIPFSISPLVLGELLPRTTQNMRLYEKMSVRKDVADMILKSLKFRITYEEMLKQPQDVIAKLKQRYDAKINEMMNRTSSISFWNTIYDKHDEDFWIYDIDGMKSYFQDGQPIGEKERQLLKKMIDIGDRRYRFDQAVKKEYYVLALDIVKAMGNNELVPELYTATDEIRTEVFRRIDRDNLIIYMIKENKPKEVLDIYKRVGKEKIELKNASQLYEWLDEKPKNLSMLWIVYRLMKLDNMDLVITVIKSALTPENREKQVNSNVFDPKEKEKFI